MILNQGIQGWHLNSNVAAIDSGILMNTTTESLEIKLKTDGGLLKDNDGLYIDTSDLSWMSSYLVSSIIIDGTGITGDVTFGTPNTDPYMDVIISNTGNTVNFDVSTDTTALNALIDLRVDAATIGSHTHAMSDVTGLSTALDEKVDGDVTIGNIKIVTTGANAGLHIESAGGKVGKLVIDDSYNVGIEPII
jgi:hypothetical protein